MYDAATLKILEDLHGGLLGREMPEVIAVKLLGVPEILAETELADMLRKAASQRPRYSAMSSEWFEPVSPVRQIKMAHTLFQDWIIAAAIKDIDDPRIIDAEEKDPAKIAAFIELLSASIKKTPGVGDFRSRMDRGIRALSDIDLSNSVYNKRYRFLLRFEEHLRTYAKEYRLHTYRIAGKVGLVKNITLKAFSHNVFAAAFIAWYAARKRRRSQFTNGKQSRAFDTISEHLLKICRRECYSVDWLLLARVIPEQGVLDYLVPSSKASLLAEWTNVLTMCAKDLKRLYVDGKIDVDTMIVHQGNDSSSWNIAAQAWNNARMAWMALTVDLGYQAIFNHLLPGKVMRLMAADVAYWHRSGGGNIHPDTKVWRQLPKPWDVMLGTVDCGLAVVEQACADAGIDSAKTGWTEPRINTIAEDFWPTPELVHGVSVDSPFLASILMKMGAFSGKKLKLNLPEEDPYYV